MCPTPAGDFCLLARFIYELHLEGAATKILLFTRVRETVQSSSIPGQLLWRTQWSGCEAGSKCCFSARLPGCYASQLTLTIVTGTSRTITGVCNSTGYKSSVGCNSSSVGLSLSDRIFAVQKFLPTVLHIS